MGNGAFDSKTICSKLYDHIHRGVIMPFDRLDEAAGSCTAAYNS